MMAVFAKNKQCSEPPPAKSRQKEATSHTTFISTSPTLIQRNSKLNRIGMRVKQRLVKSQQYHKQQHTSDRANTEIKSMVSETTDGVLNKYALRSCREAARKMEDLLFTVGGAERIVATLQYFKYRQSVQELDIAMNLIDGDNSNRNRSKEGKINVRVFEGLRDCFSMFKTVQSGEGGV